VFKGREAKLNRAIFRTLALTGSQTIYDLHKKVRRLRGLTSTHYGNVNKRVRALDKLGYVKALNTQDTKAGFEATVYELTSNAYLAIILDSSSMDNLLERMGEDVASEILIAISGLT